MTGCCACRVVYVIMLLDCVDFEIPYANLPSSCAARRKPHISCRVVCCAYSVCIAKSMQKYRLCGYIKYEKAKNKMQMRPLRMRGGKTFCVLLVLISLCVSVVCGCVVLHHLHPFVGCRFVGPRCYRSHRACFSAVRDAIDDANGVSNSLPNNLKCH